MVADALSQKSVSMDSLAHLYTMQQPLALDIHSLANRLVRLDISDSMRILDFVGVQSLLIDQIHARQYEDASLVSLI